MTKRLTSGGRETRRTQLQRLELYETVSTDARAHDLEMSVLHVNKVCGLYLSLSRCRGERKVMGGHSTSVVDTGMKGLMRMISMRERSSNTKRPADPWLRIFYTAVGLVLRCGGPDVWPFQTMNVMSS